MQISSTGQLCFTSNCKLKETKIRRQTTITRGIRNSQAMLIQKAQLVDQYEGLFYVGSYQISGKLHSKSLLVTNYLKSLCLGTVGGLRICMQHYTEQPYYSLVRKTKKIRCSPRVNIQECYLVTTNLAKVAVVVILFCVFCFFKSTTAATVFLCAL